VRAMKAIFRNTASKARFLLGPVVIAVVVALVLISSLAYAGSTSNLRILQTREDRFYNYDFMDDVVSSTGVAWPVTMMFYNNAWTSKVKDDIYWGTAGPLFAVREYAKLNNGGGWIWDSDRGTKHLIWSSYLNAYVYLHMRVYAPNPPDYMYTNGWGKYVLGTTHYDEFPELPGLTWHGFSEFAENDLASLAMSKGYSVFEDWTSFYNEEDYRYEGNLIYFNNGDATAVYIP